MADKHTPGPWRVYGKDDHLRIEAKRQSSSHMVIVEGVGGYRLGDDYSDLSQLEANARLIAAAPELLEALHQITREYRRLRSDEMSFGDTADIVCVQAALKAMAKARGDQ